MVLPRLKLEKRPPPTLKMKVAAAIGSIALALLFSSILIVQAGVNPLVGYFHLFYGALGDKLSLTETFVRFCPLALTGVACAIAFLCKFWNIGAEGQLYAGGLAATFFGISFLGAPSYLIIPLMTISGFLGGAFWAFIPAALKTRWKVDEVVTTLLGNWIIYFITGAILYGPWQNPVTKWPESPAISEAAKLPILIPGTRFHLGIVLALIVVLIYLVIYWGTAWGYELKAIGANPEASYSMGIKVERNMVLAAILSGGIAGLAGAFEVNGLNFHMKLDLSHGYGYTGIVIAMLGGLHPVGVALAAFFMAIIVTGTQAMHRVTGVPFPLSEVIQGLSLICLLLGNFLTEYRVRRVVE